ncbi:uncharacterized protein [Sinocyclocheilus grahami]|uniref:uncharacterized protein n=1 Tax=Sinocyclocheilus grahami TaxID=75366 RepID=UPI0007ACA89D|nr:PREDICTED: uncharacterized protein LOC107550048 [Sinocyclocheilus grahami]
MKEGLSSKTHTGFKQLEGFDIEGLPSAVWPGGETEALTRIERHLERKAWVANFERPRMNANSLLASPTGLSPYLRFGCLSCRLFYFKLTDLYRKVKKTSTPPLSLYGQLLWREFFYTAATNNPRFDKMEGNPICVRIPWDKNPDALAKWAEAKTGFPWIDAIMTQLRQEGWIHHLARHAVACFLTRGDLWISWEEGMKVFEELLLDADWSVNAGSWMWLSCSSFFQQFFHCYCPVGFGRRTDPNGDFIRLVMLLKIHTNSRLNIMLSLQGPCLNARIGPLGIECSTAYARDESPGIERESYLCPNEVNHGPQDVTVPGKRVLVSFGKMRGPPSSRGQYTAFLLWRLAGFSALAWDHCRLKSDQWQCEGQGENLNLSLSPEFRFVEAGGMGLWEGALSLDLEGLGGPGHCLCFLIRVVVGISVVSQHRRDLLSSLKTDILKAPAVSGGSSGKRSGSILLKFDSEKQQGPSGIQQQQQQQQSGYHHMTDTGHSSRIYKCNVSHDMTGPQHSAGHMLHSGGSVTGKRARESERDLDGEDDTLSTSHKLQRQIAEVTSVHSGKQSSMKS